MVTIGYRGVFLMACSLCLYACSPEHDSSEPAENPVSDQQAPQPAPAQDPEISGLDAYNKVCARCHETGIDGAPVTGNPADWENRSDLWQAVLMEHAKAGYLGMPAKGGDAALSDWTIDAATQYMLEITFPNHPRD
jgi:cytochrome c5